MENKKEKNEDNLGKKVFIYDHKIQEEIIQLHQEIEKLKQIIQNRNKIN